MEKNSTKTKVYNVIIMDRSGSMWSIQKPAIMGYNELLSGVKEASEKFKETQEQYFTLVLFDSSEINFVYWNFPVNEALPLNEKSYVPGSCTPLYDAIGRTLTKLDKEIKDDPDHSVIVTIITDGYENSSTEFNLSAIKKMIKYHKKQGWTFAYMGTDHDVDQVTESLSITNTITFEKSEEQTLETFAFEKESRMAYMKDLNEYNLQNPTSTADAKIRFMVGRSDSFYKPEKSDDKKDDK